MTRQTLAAVLRRRPALLRGINESESLEPNPSTCVPLVFLPTPSRASLLLQQPPTTSSFLPSPPSPPFASLVRQLVTRDLISTLPLARILTPSLGLEALHGWWFAILRAFVLTLGELLCPLVGGLRSATGFGIEAEEAGRGLAVLQTVLVANRIWALTFGGEEHC